MSGGGCFLFFWQAAGEGEVNAVEMLKRLEVREGALSAVHERACLRAREALVNEEEPEEEEKASKKKRKRKEEAGEKRSRRSIKVLQGEHKSGSKEVDGVKVRGEGRGSDGRGERRRREEGEILEVRRRKEGGESNEYHESTGKEPRGTAGFKKETKREEDRQKVKKSRGGESRKMQGVKKKRRKELI